MKALLNGSCGFITYLPIFHVIGFTFVFFYLAVSVGSGLVRGANEITYRFLDHIVPMFN